MCPPPRRLALEANGCFMVQVLRESYRIQGCGAITAPQRRAPPGILNASIVVAQTRMTQLLAIEPMAQQRKRL